MIFNDIPTLFCMSLYLWGITNYLISGSSRILLLISILCIFIGWQPLFQIISINFLLIIYFYKLKDQRYADLVKSTAILLVLAIAINSAGIISEFLYTGGSSPSLESFMNRVGGNNTIDSQFENTTTIENFIHVVGYGFVSMMIPAFINYNPVNLTNIYYVAILFALIIVSGSIIYKRNFISFLITFGLIAGTFLYMIIFKRFVLFHNFQMIYFAPAISFLCAILIEPFKIYLTNKYVKSLIFLSIILLFFYGFYKSHLSKLSNSLPMSSLTQIDDISKILYKFQGIPIANKVSKQNTLMQGFAPNYFFDSNLSILNGEDSPLTLTDDPERNANSHPLSTTLFSGGPGLSLQLNWLNLRSYLLPRSKFQFDSVFEVFYFKNSLYYFTSNCSDFSKVKSIYIQVAPINDEDLSKERRQYHADQFEFTPDNFIKLNNNVCIAAYNLPNYPIKGLNTGTIAPDYSFINKITFMN